MNEEPMHKYSLDGLQKTALTIMTALVLITFLASNLQAVLWQSSAWLVSTVLPATVVELTNDERLEVNQAPLRRSATLDAAAQMKAAHMAENEYFSHYSPDGVSPWFWFDQSGYTYAHAGENLAIHFTDSTEVVDAWMRSPSHKKNIVSGIYTEIGVGTARGEFEGFETVYVVQLFGTPGAALVAPPVSQSVAIAQAPTPPPAPVVTEAPAVAAAATPAEVPVVLVEPAPVAAEPTPVPVPVAPIADLSPETTSPTEPAAPVVEVPSTPVAVDPVVEVSTEEVPAPAAFSENNAIHDMMFLESSLIATSSGLAVASFTEPSAEHAGATLASIATKPNTLLQYIYLTLGLIVLLLLTTSIVVEARRLHYIQVAYSFALVFAMGGLWFVNSLLTAGALIA